TGLRISEAIGLQRRHLALDGSKPHVKVRRAIVKRREEPPKSRHGKRNVPLSASLVSKLRQHLADASESPTALVFPSSTGTALDLGAELDAGQRPGQRPGQHGGNASHGNETHAIDADTSDSALLGRIMER